MSLKAKRTSGDRFTNEDRIETQLTYTGIAHSVLHSIEHVSGPTCTHGGGAPAGEFLHYHNISEHADNDGVIDYSTSRMFVVQESKGTSVIKVVAQVLLQADIDQWDAEHSAWSDAYETIYLNNQGQVAYVEIADGAPDRPVRPEPTTHKSGELTLEWLDDSFV